MQTHTTSATQAAPARLAVEILQVPAPPQSAFRAQKFAVIFFMAMLPVGLFDLWIVQRSRPGALPGPVLTFTKIVIISAVVLFPLLALAMIARRRRAARALRVETPPTLTHPGSSALYEQWSQSGRCPTENAILGVLSAYPPSEPMARVVVLGDLEIPTVGDLFFEPEISTPVEQSWNRTGTLITGAVILLIGSCYFFGVKHLLFRQFAFQGIAMLGLGGMLLGWRAFIRPAYLRLAPGIVEWIQYPTLGRRGSSNYSIPSR